MAVTGGPHACLRLRYRLLARRRTVGHNSSALASARAGERSAPPALPWPHTRSTPTQIAMDMSMAPTRQQIWQLTLLTGTGGVTSRHTAARTSTARHGFAANGRFQYSA